MDPLKMYFLLKMGIIHCYVSLPEGRLVQPPPRKTACTMDPPRSLSKLLEPWSPPEEVQTLGWFSGFFFGGFSRGWREEKSNFLVMIYLNEATFEVKGREKLLLLLLLLLKITPRAICVCLVYVPNFEGFFSCDSEKVRSISLRAPSHPVYIPVSLSLIVFFLMRQKKVQHAYVIKPVTATEG